MYEISLNVFVGSSVIIYSVNSFYSILFYESKNKNINRKKNATAV